jgi:DNA mismatch repair protein MSH4
MAIIDELGRGTSTRDGLAIAIAIAEALVESRALVWFATHFRDLATIMAERNGVVNLHLAVDMDATDYRMEMLYRIASGSVQEEHYGLALARIVSLPEDILPFAENVSRTLEAHGLAKQERSIGVVRARRRKLMLNLKEHLLQARESKMDERTLGKWLRDLQEEFVVRMSALDDEAREMMNKQGGEVGKGSVVGEEEEEVRMSTEGTDYESRDGREGSTASTHSTRGDSTSRQITTAS